MSNANIYLNRRDVLKTGGVAVAGLTAGCTSLIGNAPLDQVSVGITDIRAPSIGLTSLTLPIIFEFVNQAEASVPDISVEGDVLIEGAEVASAKTSIGSLDAGEAVDERVNITISYSEVASAIVEAIRAGDFTARIQGRMESTAMLGNTARDFAAAATY